MQKQDGLVATVTDSTVTEIGNTLQRAYEKAFSTVAVAVVVSGTNS